MMLSSVTLAMLIALTTSLSTGYRSSLKAFSSPVNIARNLRRGEHHMPQNTTTTRHDSPIVFTSPSPHTHTTQTHNLVRTINFKPINNSTESHNYNKSFSSSTEKNIFLSSILPLGSVQINNSHVQYSNPLLWINKINSTPESAIILTNNLNNSSNLHMTQQFTTTDLVSNTMPYTTSEQEAITTSPVSIDTRNTSMGNSKNTSNVAEKLHFSKTKNQNSSERIVDEKQISKFNENTPLLNKTYSGNINNKKPRRKNQLRIKQDKANSPLNLSTESISRITLKPESQFRLRKETSHVDSKIHDSEQSNSRDNISSKSIATTEAGASVDDSFMSTEITNVTGIYSTASSNDMHFNYTESTTGISGTHVASSIQENISKPFSTEITVLKVDKNSSKLIGFSDDPFHVSESLHGLSRSVEIVHDVQDIPEQSENSGLIKYLQKNLPDLQQKLSTINRNIFTAATLPYSRETVPTISQDKIYPTSGIPEKILTRSSVKFRGLNPNNSEDDIPNYSDETDLHETNSHGSILKNSKEASAKNMNLSRIIHHEGISYIRKNFLIMPIYNETLTPYLYPIGGVLTEEIEVSPSNTSSQSLDITTTESIDPATETSLLNQRVPIYQEIANTLHIDSSIDDTLDSDEPITPAAEEDTDEKYLPLANSSLVNLVDPLVKVDDDENVSNHSEIEDLMLQNITDSDENRNVSNPKTKKFHKERHYSFVLKQKADLMMSLLDQNVDPCHDFYQFACGGWSDRFTLRPDQAVDNTFERLRDDLSSVLVSLLEEPNTAGEPRYTALAKTLYRGCMDIDAIEAAGTQPLRTLLQDLGGWPVLVGDSWNASGFDLTAQMATLRTLNNEVLIAENVADDVTNSSRRIVQLDQPKLGLPGRNYYLSTGDQKYREAYLTLMRRASELLGADPLIAARDMADVMFFETQIAKLLVPAEERRNLSAIHRRYTRERLKKEYPGISWDTYLDAIAPGHSAHTQEVRLFCHQYLHDLLHLLNNTSSRTVSNYLLWRLVKNRLGNLGADALEAKQEYIRVLFGRSTQPNRWRSCITYVNGNLGGIVGSMFVARYFPEDSRRDTEEMIGLIREAFGESVTEAEWMLPETRQTAADKVRAIVWNVGYPNELLNATHMEHLYGGLKFSPDTHFSNVLTMLRYHASQSHSQLGTPVNRTTWAASPATVNAYYSRTKNMIMFPAGILQPPFYHHAYPRALNYGGIGVVIGHEISHGFDDGGRQFDKKGNLKQWWSKKDVMAFYARATCMLEQYSKFSVPELGLPVNAITTLGENIADNAGLDIALTAYRKWALKHKDTSILPQLNMTHTQLFFLNFGQIWCEVNTPEAALTNLRSGRHSPNRFRVIGTLSNSVAFNEAFQCPVGSAMNPSDKCAVW